MLPELNIGIVGAGWAAREHATSLAHLSGTRITAVFDTDSSAADALKRDFGAPNAHSHSSLDDLLADNLNAIIVATPSGLHRAAIEPALELGIGVFVEKPLSRTVEDADAIARAASRPGAVCAVGYQWRALDPLLGVRARLRGEEIAMMISQGVAMTQSRAWFADSRLSGGLLFERVSHHIDLQRMLAGEVANVSAVRGGVAISGSPMPGGACDDVISLTLRFESGAVGAIHVVGSPAGYPSTQSTRVFTKADAYDFELDPVFSFHRQAEPPQSRPSEHPFSFQMRRFLEATRAQDPTLVCCSPAEATGTVRAAAAAERALVEQTQISIDSVAKTGQGESAAQGRV